MSTPSTSSVQFSSNGTARCTTPGVTCELVGDCASAPEKIAVDSERSDRTSAASPAVRLASAVAPVSSEYVGSHDVFSKNPKVGIDDRRGDVELLVEGGDETRRKFHGIGRRRVHTVELGHDDVPDAERSEQSPGPLGRSARDLVEGIDDRLVAAIGRRPLVGGVEVVVAHHRERHAVAVLRRRDGSSRASPISSTW